MGGVSALIVSPCVAAPLAGALLYLSQTRNVWLGGTALFSLAAGMSVPLLLVGASAGALLPRAGAWMVEVKTVVRRAAARRRALDGAADPARPLALALWGALALGTAAIVMRAVASPRAGAAASTGAPRRRVWPGARRSPRLFALIGVLRDRRRRRRAATDPLQPLARFTSRGDVAASPGVPQLHAGPQHRRARRGAAQGAGRPVMLDFYADWCVSCKEMERFTFTDAGGAAAAGRRVAAARRRHGELGAGPRAAAALPSVRAAGDDLLRRAAATRSAPPAWSASRTARASSRPCRAQGSEPRSARRRLLYFSAQSRGGAVW